MAGGVGPRSGVIVGHQVDVVKDTTEVLQLEEVEVVRASGGGHGELVVVVITDGGGVGVEGVTNGLEEEDLVGSVGGAGGVLPIDINTVETPVLQEGDSGVGELLAGSIAGSNSGEVGRPGPATDGEDGLKTTVGLLELEELLDATVGVVAGVAPGVTGVVLLKIGIRVTSDTASC